MTYPVVEIFSSINGEGIRAGELAVFVRFRGCNLHCSYCDTRWACEADAPATHMTAEEITDAICQTGIRNVTLTGGEPLLQKDIPHLLSLLISRHLSVEIETNGSIPLAPFRHPKLPVIFTMDYKLPDSGMESHMHLPNLETIRSTDVVKFVSGSKKDLARMSKIIDRYDLLARCQVYVSPVFDTIHPADIVDFMKSEIRNGLRLQLQLHKYIWDPDMRGV